MVYGKGVITDMQYRNGFSEFLVLEKGMKLDCGIHRILMALWAECNRRQIVLELAKMLKHISIDQIPTGGESL